MLIALQCPTATRVAGFQAWKGLKRSVKKGATGIAILAPMQFGAKKESKLDDEDATLRPATMGFRAVYVFDISQTTGEDLPTLETNATEGGDALLPLLESTVTGLNISLTYKALGGVDGLSRGGAVEIEESLNTPARCGVIAHELAHEILKHKDRHADTTTQQRELEAESVAYAVLAHFGMKPQSHFYLASYDVTAEMLTASLKVISAAAKQIIDLLSQSNEEGKGEAGTPGTPALALAA
jgi:hypothetical protein